MHDSNIITRKWWPVIVGLLFIFTPIYYQLISRVWTKEEYAYGPIILISILILFWKNGRIIFSGVPQYHPLIGSTIFFFGLLCFVTGSVFDILILEIGSQVPILFGLLILLTNKEAIKVLWFPIAFLLFLIPLPAFIVDTLTSPLKQLVSIFVDHILHAFGYPIARSGVILTVGPYQMLIADACSGINSIFSLFALGSLYIYIRSYKNKIITMLLIASLLPIAFLVNTTRVTSLVLITYYMGDEAGQGFLHNFAGITEIVLAMLLFFTIDTVLVNVFRPNAKIDSMGHV